MKMFLNHLQLSTGRCDPGRNDASCCTDAAQCSEGEGDCDYDIQCGWDLVCGEDNCQLWNPLAIENYDCCKKASFYQGRRKKN